MAIASATMKVMSQAVAASTHFMPTGTVYGTLLNFKAEVAAMQAQMSQPPYKAPPHAPVLYIKPVNTWSANGAAIAVPKHVPAVEIGATIAMVVRQQQGSEKTPKVHFVLMNDLSIPHSSFFRPPVKYKCVDGFLGIGSQLIENSDLHNVTSNFTLAVRINDALVQKINFTELVRPASQLLTDVSEFMTLHTGDVLMLGCDCLANGKRPLAKVGDIIAISAPSHPALGILSNRLVAETL